MAPLPWKSFSICSTAHAGTGTHLQIADALACMVHSSICTLQRHKAASSSRSDNTVSLMSHAAERPDHKGNSCDLLPGQLWPRDRQRRTPMPSSIAQHSHEVHCTGDIPHDLVVQHRILP